MVDGLEFSTIIRQRDFDLFVYRPLLLDFFTRKRVPRLNTREGKRIFFLGGREHFIFRSQFEITIGIVQRRVVPRQG